MTARPATRLAFDFDLGFFECGPCIGRTSLREWGGQVTSSRGRAGSLGTTRRVAAACARLPVSAQPDRPARVG